MHVEISPASFLSFLHLSILFLFALLFAIVVHEMGHVVVSASLGIRADYHFTSVAVYASDPDLIAQVGAGGNAATTIVGCGALVTWSWLPKIKFVLMIAFTCLLMTGVNVAINYWM